MVPTSKEQRLNILQLKQKPLLASTVAPYGRLPTNE